MTSIRLVRFLALAVLLSGGDALAFVRSTTSGQPGSGLCLWWRNRQIAYAVNASAISTPGCQDAAAAEALIGASFSTWAGATRAGEGRPCTDLSFLGCGATTQTATGNDGVNLVVLRKGLCSDFPGFASCIQSKSSGACAAQFNCWQYDMAGGGVSTLALTTTTYDTSTGEILDADVELHAWSSAAAGAYFTCADAAAPACSNPPNGQSGCTWVDLGTIATHEIGHFIGLDHTCHYPAPYDFCTAGSVMDPQIDKGITHRDLAADDVSAVCTIYPAGAATLTCAGTIPAGGASATCEGPKKDSPGGCSTGGGTGVGALLGAFLAGWRFRRARRSS